MAEKAPSQAEQGPKSQEEFEAMQKELGPLVEKMQKGTPQEKLKAAKRILEILAIFKQMMGDKFAENEQLVQLEQVAQQTLGSLEG